MLGRHLAQFVDAFFYIVRRAAITAQASDQIFAAERPLIELLEDFGSHSVERNDAAAGDEIEKILAATVELVEFAERVHGHCPTSG